MIIKRQKSFSIAYKAKKVLVRGRQAKRGANKLAWDMQLNPRGTIKEGLAKTAENPLTVASQVAATPVHVATAGALGPTAQLVTAALPNSVPYVLGEAAIKKHVPAYAKATKKAGQAVRGSKTLDAAMGVQPTVTFRNAGPNASLGERVKYNVRSGLADISGGIQSAGKSAIKLIRGYSDHD
jgi:hypothetical protein